MLTLTLRVTEKHAFPSTKINTPSIFHESLSKVFICQKKSMGYAKKISMLKSMREKNSMSESMNNPMLRSMKKSKKRKKRKIAHTFK
jgi:hypothetical protein